VEDAVDFAPNTEVTMSRREKQIYHKLVRLAGGSALVEEALSELSRKRQAAPDLEEVVDYIVAQRQPAGAA
jgi:hypothetical protein